jgi:hypothetical protein
VDQKKGYFSQYDCKLTCEKNPGLYFLEPSQVGRGFADPKSAASIHYEPADGALMGKPGKNYRKDYNDVGGFQAYFHAMHYKNTFYRFSAMDFEVSSIVPTAQLIGDPEQLKERWENPVYTNNDASFFRFDSKLFYIIKKLKGNDEASINGGLAKRAIPYTCEQRFSLPTSLVIKDCILKKQLSTEKASSIFLFAFDLGEK